ncbi:SDR family NAD(P)-dependent oxidoreductase [Caballeronia sp. 15715]|uniref:SDR family NAD(P)-dependent oxidoreductase n=1 Tax=unclassified Caballeronia TaxID=2646786 RepID=UPI0039E47A79
MSKLSLEGKVALVTGASSGIGRASARLLAARGARVVVADLDEEGGNETVKLIGKQAVFVRVDISDERSVQELVDKTVETFGRLDIAHNNAAIYLTGANFADVDTKTWDRVLGINLTGMFFAMRAEIPAMLATGGGSIINMSSVAGIVAQPGQPGYVPAKHGVIGLTKAAAVEYSGQNIRVNVVLPGPTNTPMVQRMLAESPDLAKALKAAIPIQRLGEPEDAAEAVAWLASDAASFVSGASIPVDGGFTAQ